MNVPEPTLQGSIFVSSRVGATQKCTHSIAENIWRELSHTIHQNVAVLSPYQAKN
jgi:hypothetical protein